MGATDNEPQTAVLIELIALKSISQIFSSNELVVDDLFRRSFSDHLSVRNNQRPLDHPQGERDVMIGDQNRFVEFIAKAFHLAAEVFLGAGIDSSERFVQKDQFGLRHQRGQSPGVGVLHR